MYCSRNQGPYTLSFLPGRRGAWTLGTLDRFYFRLTGRCWSRSQLHRDKGEGTPLDEWPALRRALCEQLWVGYLAQGYPGIAMELFWHLPHLPGFVRTRSWTENPPLSTQQVTTAPIKLTPFNFKLVRTCLATAAGVFMHALPISHIEHGPTKWSLTTEAALKQIESLHERAIKYSENRIFSSLPHTPEI